MSWVSIGSGNVLSPIRRQAIILTNAPLLSTGPLGTNFSEIRIGFFSFSFTKRISNCRLPAWRPFCSGGDELNHQSWYQWIDTSRRSSDGNLKDWLVCDLNRTPVVMAKHGGSCVHFSGISSYGRTSLETVSYPQCPPLPTLYKISLPVYIIWTIKRLQPLTTTWYNSLVLSFCCWKFLDV